MRKWTLAWLAPSILSLIPPAALAQAANLTGSWTVQMTAQPSQRGAAAANACTFQGTANVTQNGSQLNGDLSVDKLSGDMTCPPFMSGTMTGSVSGSSITMGVMVGGGMLGQATFTGAVTAVRSGAAEAVLPATGATTRTGAAPAPGTMLAVATAPRTVMVPAAAPENAPASAPRGVVAAAAGASGTYVTTSGPFAGTTGSWSAVQLAPIATVPALNGRGLALLALLLLGAASWLLWRRTAPRST